MSTMNSGGAIGQGLGSNSNFHIYDFGPDQSVRYAEGERYAEGLRKLGDPAAISAHAWVNNVIGETPAIQETSHYLHVPPPSPWATVSAPPKWGEQRRGLFGSTLMVSRGSKRDVELSQANVESTQTNTLSQERQKGALITLFHTADALEADMHLIRGNMGRFLGA